MELDEPATGNAVFRKGLIYSDVTIDTPERFDYECFTDISTLKYALTTGTRAQNILVVRREYIRLREALEKMELGEDMDTQGVVVMGHPGIGSYAADCQVLY